MKSWFYWNNNYLINELKPIFKKQYLREDIFAGLTVACVAIPLSLAIAMASGVDAGIGLISAIIGGIIAALLGGTRMAVTGPAAAMAILIADCVAKQGLAGLLVIGLICGALQIIFGLLRLGRFAKLVPLPVISAFTAGIGFIIFISQLPKALQLPASEESHVFDIIHHTLFFIEAMNVEALILTITAMLILILLPKYFPKLPAPLIAVAIPTAVVYFFNFPDIQLVGSIPHSLPMPSLPNFNNIVDWQSLIGSALAVFMLASLETLLSSSAIDGMGTGDLHNPNQELIGQGTANIGTALFGGLPVTGVIARSSVNLASGAKTRRSPIIHSIAILVVVYCCPQLVEIIPVAALAAILLNAALSMMSIREIVEFWKIDKTEVVVYLVTFCAIVATDLLEGIQAGIIVAFLIVALRMLTTKTSFRLWTNKNVLRVSLSGSMTFWSFEELSKIKEYISRHSHNLKFIIFEFEELQGLDSTGAKHLINVANEIDNKGIHVIFHGMTAEQGRMIAMSSPNSASYKTTIMESEIKDILENSGIRHSANDVLKHGMHKFLGRYVNDHKELLNNLAKEQKPHTLIITCSDSRLNPNGFLSSGLGELFIVRNVGNVVPRFSAHDQCSEGAAIEFALDALKIRNILICGHTECGAVKATLGGGEILPPNLNKWLSLIRSGLSLYSKDLTLDEGIKLNLRNQLENLKTYPMVADLLERKELTISGWIYDINSAHMLEFDTGTNDFVPIVKK